MKIWHWILLFIFLTMVFLFRFKYMTVGTEGAGLLRINRITGIAKVYEWDYSLGKFKLYKIERTPGIEVDFDEAYKIDLDKILKNSLNEVEE